MNYIICSPKLNFSQLTISRASAPVISPAGLLVPKYVCEKEVFLTSHRAAGACSCCCTLFWLTYTCHRAVSRFIQLRLPFNIWFGRAA